MKRKKVSMLIAAAAVAAMTVNPMVGCAEDIDVFSGDTSVTTTDPTDWADTWNDGTVSTTDGVEVYGDDVSSGDITDPWGGNVSAPTAEQGTDNITDNTASNNAEAETTAPTITGDNAYTYQTYTGSTDPNAVGLGAGSYATTQTETEAANAMDVKFMANGGTFDDGTEEHVMKSNDWTVESGEMASGQFKTEAATIATEDEASDSMVDPLANFGDGSKLFAPNNSGVLRYVYVSGMWDLKDDQEIVLTDDTGKVLVTVNSELESHNFALVLDQIPNITIKNDDAETEVNYKISWTAAYGAGEGTYSVPEREGYIFTGWYMDDVSISVWTGEPRENVYAGWVAEVDVESQDSEFRTASGKVYAAALGEEPEDTAAGNTVEAAPVDGTVSAGYTPAEVSEQADGTAANDEVQMADEEEAAEAKVFAAAADETPAADATTSEDSKTTDSKKSTVAAYTVQHLLMDTDGKNYTVRDTEHLTGTAGTTVSPSVKSYEGFNSPNIQTATIAADGSTVVDYRYTRQTFNFALTQIEGADLSGSTPSGSKYYGETITLKCVPASGYEFDSWSNGDKSASTTLVMPAGDVTITPSVKTAAYKITYNLDGGTASNPETYTSDTESFVLEQPKKEGYIFAGWTGANGSTPQTSVTIGKGTAGNLTFTANWVINGDVTPTTEQTTEADGITVGNVQTGDTTQPMLYTMLAAVAALCAGWFATLKKRTRKVER